MGARKFKQLGDGVQRTGAKLVQGLVWVFFGTARRSLGEEGNTEMRRLRCDLKFGIFFSGLL
jgi:hypothetical protein